MRSLFQFGKELTKAQWVEPLKIWLLTRLICLTFLYLGCMVYRPQEMDSLLAPFIRFDAIHYLAIVEGGYANTSSLPGITASTAFFPLFPCLIKGVSALGFSPALSAILLSNGATLIAAYLLYIFTIRFYDQLAARWALWMWLSYPFSIFGSVPYPESILALFSLLWLFHYWDRNYLLSGFWGGLASAVRPQGFLLALPLFFQGIFSRSTRPLASCLLCISGLLAFMYYLYTYYGDPLLFITAQKYWGKTPGFCLNPLEWIWLIIKGSISCLYKFFSGELWLKGNLIYFNALFTAYILCWIPLVWKRFDGCLACMILMMVFLQVQTGIIQPLGRHSWQFMPVFVVMGSVIGNYRGKYIILSACLTLLAWFSFFYGGFLVVI